MAIAYDDLREEINNRKLRIKCESFVSGQTATGVRAIGLALPFNKISRNDFTYITESIHKSYKTLEGCPVLFNHNSDRVIGHVKEVYMSDEGLMYEFDLDPDDEIAKKVKRGDLSKVSIQCMFDEDKSDIDDEGVTHAYITEFLELSVVSIPGFADTTVQLQEKLRNKESKVAIEPANKDEKVWNDAKKAFNQSYGREPKSDDDLAIVMTIYQKLMGETMDKNKEQENPLDAIMAKVAAGDKLSEDEVKLLSAAVDAAKGGEETSEEQSDDDSNDATEEIRKEMDDIKKRIEELEGYMKKDDASEESTSKEEDDDEEDMEKAKKEALEKDKKSVSVESTSPSKITLSERDVRDALIEVFG